MFLSVLNHKLCSNFKFHLLKLRYGVYIYIDAWWIKNVHIRHGLTMVIHNLTALIKFFRSTCMYTLCNFSFSSHRNSDIISCSFETHYSLVEQLCIYIFIFFSSNCLCLCLHCPWGKNDYEPPFSNTDLILHFHLHQVLKYEVSRCV